MATEKVLKIKGDVKDLDKKLDKLTEAVGDLSNTLKGVGDQAKENLGEVEKQAEKGSKAVKGMKKSTGIASKGFFKVLKGAIAATGIGLLVTALAALGQAFFKNQKVVDAFNVVMKVVEKVVGDFVNLVVDNSGPVIDFFKKIFNDPQESIKKLGKLIKDNLNREDKQYYRCI